MIFIDFFLQISLHFLLSSWILASFSIFPIFCLFFTFFCHFPAFLPFLANLSNFSNLFAFYFAVVLTDIKFDVLTLIIQYVYCGKTIVDDHQFNDFMETARKFELIGFRDDDFAINITKIATNMPFSHVSSTASAKYPTKRKLIDKEMPSPKVSSTTPNLAKKRKRSPIKTNSEDHGSDADAEDNNNNEQPEAKKSSK